MGTVTVNTALNVISPAPGSGAGHRQSRVVRVEAVGFEQPFGQSPGQRTYGHSAGPSDRASVLRSAVMGQYVRMAQHLGETAAPHRPNAGGADMPVVGDVTNLQRDMLQSFLEQMGGLKSANTGSYVSLRA